MNVELLPSAKFKTNMVYLPYAMLAFKLFRIIGQLFIDNEHLVPVKINGKRRRLWTDICDLI